MKNAPLATPWPAFYNVTGAGADYSGIYSRGSHWSGARFPSYCMLGGAGAGRTWLHRLHTGTFTLSHRQSVFHEYTGSEGSSIYHFGF